MPIYLKFGEGAESVVVEADTMTPVIKPLHDEGKAGARGVQVLDERESKATLDLGRAVSTTVLKMESGLSTAFGAIRANAQAFMKEVAALDLKPSEIEMTFALKASGELGNFVVGKITGDANYKVKMTWKQ